MKGMCNSAARPSFRFAPVLVVALVVFSHPSIGSCATPITAKALVDLNAYEMNALFLAQGSSKDGFLDEGIVEELATALGAVVSRYPDMQEILEHSKKRYHSITHLSLRLADGAEITVGSQGMKFLGPQQYYGSRGERLLSTGITEIDRLNELFDMNRIEFHESYDNSFWLSLQFGRSVDLLALIPIYERIKEVKHAQTFRLSRTLDLHSGPFARTRKTQPSFLSEILYTPSGTTIVFIPKGAMWHFVFTRSRRDLNGFDLFYFTYDRKTEEAIKVHEQIHQWENDFFLWSVPTRHSPLPFASYDDVASKARSNSWWLRVHALDILGYLLTEPSHSRFGASGKDLAKIVSLSADVLKNRKAGLRLLIESLNDVDDDVRAVAHHHLVENTKQDFGRGAGSVDKWLSWFAAPQP